MPPPEVKSFTNLDVILLTKLRLKDEMSITYPVTATNLTQEIDWTALYAHHVKHIYNFFRYRVGNDQVVEDLTATTFEKAWRKRHQFRGKRDEFVH